MFFPESLYLVFTMFLHLGGIIVNFLLICAIILRESAQSQSYYILMLSNTVTDTITLLITMFVNPRTVLYNSNAMYICNGPCKFFGKVTCNIASTFMLLSFGQISWLILASFIYRFWVLSHNSPKKRTITFWIILMQTPLLFELGLVSHYVLENINVDFSNEIATAHPEMDQSDLIIIGYPNVTTNISASLPTACISFPIFFVTIIVFILRHLILKNLAQYSLISEDAKRMHKEYLKAESLPQGDIRFQALTFQSLLPLLYLVGSSLFLAEFFIQLHSPSIEYGFAFTASLVPTLSPLCSFLCITHFRIFLFSPFKCYRATPVTKIEPAKITITNSV